MYQDPNAAPLGGGYAQPPPQQQGGYPGYAAVAPAPQQGGYGQPPPQQYTDQTAAPLLSTPEPQTGAYAAKPRPANTGLPHEWDITQNPPQLVEVEQLNPELLPKREKVNHRNFDISVLSNDIRGLNTMKADWAFRWDTTLACWIMFNAVSTIMIILTNFARGVDPKKKQEYGNENFDIYMGFITYAPLLYFFMAIIVFNNYYSETSFYMYLKRGMIIDFPPSGKVAWLFKHILPIIFMIFTVAYLGAVIVAFIKFSATIGVALIFLNNVFVGIGVTWYRQQSVEGKFVSISDFIQAFPDRDGQFGNIDEHSLYWAAEYLRRASLGEVDEASYSGYMRAEYWKMKNYNVMQQIAHHVMLLCVVGAMAGACIAYFVVLRGLDLKSRWQNEINPCAATCANAINNVSYPTTVTQTQCSTCICRCLASLAQTDDWVMGGCEDNAVIPACGSPDGFCPVLSSMCKREPFWPDEAQD